MVIYSDHGDMFGKHGRFMRGGPLRGTFYDDVLHIPLLIYHPAIQPKAVDELAQVIGMDPLAFRLKNLKNERMRAVLEAAAKKFGWGAKPEPLYWEYVMQSGRELPNLSPSNPKYRAAINLWTRLPVGLTKVIGPHIVRSIP